MEPFQPALPARGATLALAAIVVALGISTRAPREGSDETSRDAMTDGGTFQPALPARGATKALAGEQAQFLISTRAPREGSDTPRTSCKRHDIRISTRAPREGSD